MCCSSLSNTYSRCKKSLNVLYNHERVSHNSGEYVRTVDEIKVHTNGIEGVWALIRRSIMGIYHMWSVKHLERYLTEHTFRYNLRNEEGKCVAFKRLASQMDGRLTWKELTASNEQIAA